METVEQTSAIEKRIFDKMLGMLHSSGSAAPKSKCRGENRGFHLVGFEERDGQKGDV